MEHVDTCKSDCGLMKILPMIWETGMVCNIDWEQFFTSKKDLGALLHTTNDYRYVWDGLEHHPIMTGLNALNFMHHIKVKQWQNMFELMNWYKVVSIMRNMKNGNHLMKLYQIDRA